MALMQEVNPSTSDRDRRERVNQDLDQSQIDTHTANPHTSLGAGITTISRSTLGSLFVRPT